jgi:hypothetical protein
MKFSQHSSPKKEIYPKFKFQLKLSPYFSDIAISCLQGRIRKNNRKPVPQTQTTQSKPKFNSKKTAKGGKRKKM